MFRDEIHAGRPDRLGQELLQNARARSRHGFQDLCVRHTSVQEIHNAGVQRDEDRDGRSQNSPDIERDREKLQMSHVWSR